MTRIFIAAFWSAILSVRHNQIRLNSLHACTKNVQTCVRPFMELSSNELNGKLFHEKDQSTKEEGKEEAAEKADDPLRVITGII